ncbi:FtsX-like permease family protein [bacterium endosymbiont of Pedicinus badii]|uniref:FtsX-like permease family protein n=1 Tax=bacterium endosymbiont of Pedicinus badii TaxID=1719126 RepID=UPI0009BB369C|nr:FtsX-like permease family protein [bacterium endosymbiont of Pedicinus badii]OQM34375.1 hypothetical protein AOQ89_00585 [bacterium endosymbiont of Pedicinus badii]
MFTFPISLKFALKFSKTKNNKNKFLVSVISIIGITIGTAVLIISIGVMNGFEKEISRYISSKILHGNILLDNTTSVTLKKINELNQNKDYFLIPYIQFSGVVKHKNQLHVINMHGIPYFSEKYLGLETKNIGENEIFISKKISDLLKLNIGDHIELFFFSEKKEKNIKSIRIKIKKIVFLEEEFDKGMGWISLKYAQKILNKLNRIDGIFVKVQKIFETTKIIKKIKKNLKEKITYYYTWLDTHGYIYQDIQTVRYIVFLSVFSIMFLSFLNIAFVMIISIKEKSIEIVILQSLGAKKSFIHRIFFWYSFIISGIGNILGFLIGAIIAKNLFPIVEFLEKTLFQNKVFFKETYFIEEFTPEIEVFEIFLLFFISLFFCIIFSLYPTYLVTRKKISYFLK